MWFTHLDVLGPCRELFSNLLMDLLESLDLTCAGRALARSSGESFPKTNFPVLKRVVVGCG